jgi:hypothetical protein
MIDHPALIGETAFPARLAGADEHGVPARGELPPDRAP